MQRMNGTGRATVLTAMVFSISFFVGGCQRGESEADKPEVRDLQIDVNVGESFDPADKPDDKPVDHPAEGAGETAKQGDG